MSAPIIFNGRRAKLLTVDGILNKDGSINDYNGLVNYVENGHAEVDVAGWVTYADAAGSIPVNGTGGSPTLTFTRTTSSPLRGVGSFLITKDATNRQGEGASYDFSIDTADKAQVLQISADLEVASGTYDSGSSTTNSDLIAYIYDVTNATLIEPAGMKLQAGTKLKATFQSASNSTSYRLIFHQSLTGTSAYTLKIDNISVGPQVTASGYAGSDWVSYTPTGSWVAGSPVYTGRWRRVGDELEGQINVLLGGATTATAFTASIPSGLTIDTAKLVSITDSMVIGTGRAVDASTSTYQLLAAYNSTTTVTALANGASGTYGTNPQLSNTIPFTFGASDYVSITYRVPIVGWSSNTVASSETDTRVVNFTGTQTSQAVTANVTDLTLATTGPNDSHGGWNGTQYVVKVPGVYIVNGSGLSTLSCAFAVYVSGSLYGYFSTSDNTNQSSAGSINCGFLTVGTTISIRCTASATITVGRFGIHRLSGPAQITAEATIAVEAENVAGTSIANNTLTILAFNTITGNTNDAWSGTVFTAPVSGRYQFNVHTLLNAYTGWVLTESLELTLHKNNSGTALKYLSYNNAIPGGGANVNISSAGTAIVRLLAGETIDIRLKQVSGAAITLVGLAGTNHLEILRVGNY